MANTDQEIELARRITCTLINNGHLRDSAFTPANRIILRALRDERVLSDLHRAPQRPRYRYVGSHHGTPIYEVDDLRPVATASPWDNKGWLAAFGLLAEIERDRCWDDTMMRESRADHITWLPEATIRDRYRQYGR